MNAATSRIPSGPSPERSSKFHGGCAVGIYSTANVGA